MDLLAEQYKEHLDLQDATWTKIEHEDAIVATIYRVTPKGGEPLILKICKMSRHYWREVYCLNGFAGRLPVPRIIEVVEPRELVDGAILMECLPGRVGKIGDFTDELAFELGALLGKIHRHSIVGYGELFDSKKSTVQNFFGLKFEEIISESVDHLPPALVEKCQEYYDAHLHLLNGVDGPCIVHRDFRPGNVMINEGKIQGIIDWSSAVASFTEEDFCSMEHGEWSIDNSSKKSFYAGYASIRPVPNYDAIMPFLRLSKALHIIGFLVTTGTWNHSQSRLYRENRRFLDDFFPC